MNIYFLMTTTTTTFSKWIILIILSLATNPQILIHAKQVPCFFIFGDSLFDNGNNNGLNTKAKVNYPPYGIDYQGATPTGRFTENKNSADYLAKLLGFKKSIPPFATTTGSKILKGLNYASGAAGILDNSGKQLGERFSMNMQLDNHVKTIAQISKLRGSGNSTSYLNRCLYAVNIGSNDYINNYYLPQSESNPLYTPEEFAVKLIDAYSKQLRKLHELGARKVVVFGAGLIGCAPQELSLYPTNGTLCVEFINSAVELFDNKLVSLVTNDLNRNLPKANFTYINATSISLGDPSLIDVVKVLSEPCCEIDKKTGQCARNGKVCSNRSEYAFFDNFHPTNNLNKVAATRSYKALFPADAFPFDIQTLVQS